MCGIAGLLQFGNQQAEKACIQRMTDALSHRGPDDQGIYVHRQVALGHRRLSIIDLSPAGHQPMFSYDKRYTLVFNGEIYNYKEVKKLITDYPFSSNSDSEVILAAYAKWGPECLQYMNGMFAFAIWDHRNATLFIARDRLGVKPVYYYQLSDGFLFASEIRALIRSKMFTPTIHQPALSEFLAYQTVHAPGTILNGVKMLEPGCYMLVKNQQVEIVRWWNIEREAKQSPKAKSYREVCNDIYQLLLGSVEKRLIADVPLGAFLSGGIDSSAVVALMSKITPGNVKTFNISFDESEFNEAHYARMIASRYQTDHTEIRLSPRYFLDELPQALMAMDHPSGDGPNTYVVSKATKQKGVTVALSGLGGDELFAGYALFGQLKKLKEKRLLEAIPGSIRHLAGAAYARMRPGIATKKIEEVLRQPSFDLNHIYPINRRIFFDDEIHRLLKTATNTNAASGEPEPNNPVLPFLSQISIREINSYMQNVLLRDTDQMSMAHALEVREPFLDYELVEYVLGVPDQFKYPVTPKKLLVDALGDLLPAELVHRKKMGFSFPWKNWLSKELRPFCEEKLKNLCERPFFHRAEVQLLMEKFYTNNANVNWIRIWLLVVIENWMEQNEIS